MISAITKHEYTSFNKQYSIWKKFPITLTDVDDFTITEDKYGNA